MTSDEQKVRERWPGARAYKNEYPWWRIYSKPYGDPLSGYRDTEAEAWADAARRLEKPDPPQEEV